MARPENRSQLMERLGAVQTNTVWSWCGVNETDRKVYFSVWTDNSYSLGVQIDAPNAPGKPALNQLTEVHT